MDLHEQEEKEPGVKVDKQMQECEEIKKQIHIRSGLFKSFTIPECILNPEIPLIWHGCKYCSSVYQTRQERDEHKVKSHPERRSKRQKLNVENCSSSNAVIKTFVSPPLPLQDSNKVVSLTTTSNTTTAKKDLKKVSSPSKKSMRKRRSRHTDDEDDDADDSPRIPCDKCTDTFSNRKDLQRHKKLHSNEKTINLGTTPSSNFGNNNSLISRRNLERRGTESSSSSSSSSQQLFSDYLLDKNNNSSQKSTNNNNNSNNICPVCLKNFGFRDTLKRHLKGHKAQEEPEDERDSDDIPVLKSPRRETMRKTQSTSHSLHPMHLLQAQKGPKTSHHFRKSNEKKSLVPVVPARTTPRRKLLISKSHLESLSPDSVTFSASMF